MIEQGFVCLKKGRFARHPLRAYQEESPTFKVEY